MSRRMILVAVMIGLLWISPSTSFSQDQEYKIGVLANRGPVRVTKDWGETATLLTNKIGKAFTLVPLEYKQIDPWTKEKKIDFVLTNSAMYAELNKLYGVQAIATQVNLYKDQPLDKFGSVILVKVDSPIKTLADLKGKDFACASRSAFGGWLMTARLLRESGMNPDSDLVLKELSAHDNVVYAVLNGAVAGGSVRTGILEKMVQEGSVKMASFRIIHRIEDDFPLIHSTQLYAEYPFAACQHVPAAVKQQVAKVLVAISARDPAATNAGISGWTEPQDYSAVVECLGVLKYGAFKDTAQTPTPRVIEKTGESPPAQPGASSSQEGGPAKTPKVPRGRTSTQ
ncbi:MAG: phosphate/phosphite/phosphonate ABC transporter substrate-binding protein [Syntrophobacter sp.]